MKILFDQNLSPRLAQGLDELFPESIHVRDVGLESAGDRIVWEYATQHGFAIATKDSDFFDWVVRQPHTKIIWVATGNCSTKRIEGAFRRQYPALKKAFDEEGKLVFVLMQD